MDSLISKLKSREDTSVDLLEALQELNQMIGMEDAKEKVVEMVCEHLMNPLRTDVGSHCMVTGPPGVGKSTFITILAKILFSLGVVTSCYRNSEPKDPNEVERAILSKTTGVAFINDQATYILEDLQALGIKDPAPSNDPNVITRLKWIQTVADEFFDFGRPYLLKHGVIPEKTKLPNIVKCSRSEIIGKYQGHSATNMRTLYERAKGGILVIDEAYSLMNGSSDQGDNFGQEALDTLNQLMSEQTETVVILGGYEDQIKNRLFSSQHGLQSRIQYSFNIVPPTNKDMALMLQLRLGTWLSKDITLKNLEVLISETAIDGYGRGIAKWAKQASLVSAKRRFFSDDSTEKTILISDLLKARERCNFTHKEDLCSCMYT